MILDVQKASMWKRISAYLFDVLLLIIVIVSVAWLMSTMLGYDSYSTQFNDIRSQYESEYGVDFDADYNSLTDDKKLAVESAYDKFSMNKDAQYAYTMMIILALVIVSVSILLGHIILEFVLPLIFKNGQTLGKKAFGIALMRADGVRISAPAMFVRAILGKCVVETMVPMLILVMVFFGNAGLVGIIAFLLISLLQIILVVATKTRSAIHDLLAYSVAIDLTTQLIFDTPEELIEYKKRLHAEETLHKER